MSIMEKPFGVVSPPTKGRVDYTSWKFMVAKKIANPEATLISTYIPRMECQCTPSERASRC